MVGRKVLICVLVWGLCASGAMAYLYAPRHLTKTFTSQWPAIFTYSAGRIINAYEVTEIAVNRDGGTNPQTTVSYSVTVWVDGSVIGNAYYEGYVRVEGSATTGLFYQRVIDMRTGTFVYGGRIVMPGVTVIDVGGQVYNVVMPVHSHNVDCSEAMMSDPTYWDPPGAGDPPVVTEGGITSADKTWWGGFLESQFTLSATARSEWNAFMAGWSQVGPWGEMTTLEGFTPNVTDLPIVEPPLSSGPAYLWLNGTPVEGVKFFDFDREFAGGLAQGGNGNTPWIYNTSLSAWRVTFRNMFGCALWGYFLISMVLFIRGRIVV